MMKPGWCNVCSYDKGILTSTEFRCPQCGITKSRAEYMQELEELNAKLRAFDEQQTDRKKIIQMIEEKWASQISWDPDWMVIDFAGVEPFDFVVLIVNIIGTLRNLLVLWLEERKELWRNQLPPLAEYQIFPPLISPDRKKVAVSYGMTQKALKRNPYADHWRTTSRMKHQCTVCGRTILKGEKYWSGTLQEWRNLTDVKGGKGPICNECYPVLEKEMDNLTIFTKDGIPFFNMSFPSRIDSMTEKDGKILIRLAAKDWFEYLLNWDGQLIYRHKLPVKDRYTK